MVKMPLSECCDEWKTYFLGIIIFPLIQQSCIKIKNLASDTNLILSTYLRCQPHLIKNAKSLLELCKLNFLLYKYNPVLSKFKRHLKFTNLDNQFYNYP